MPDIYNKIEDLFDEEHKTILTITYGNRVITIAKQLRNTFENRLPYPRYKEDKLLDLAAQHIEEYIKPRLNRFTDEEEKFKKLYSPEAYQDIEETETLHGKITATNTIENKQHIKENDMLSLTQGGSGDRSRDHIGIENQWSYNVRKSLQDNAAGINIKFQKYKQTDFKDFLNLEKEIDIKDILGKSEDEEDKENAAKELIKVNLKDQPVITSYSAATSSTKNINKRLSQYETLGTQAGRNKRNNKMKRYIEANAIIKSLLQTLPKLRAELIESFHFLFSEMPPCL